MDFSNDLYFGDFGTMSDEDASKLIFALSDELPELLEEIAPDRWEESKYFHTIRRLYLQSDTIREKREIEISRYFLYKNAYPGVPYQGRGQLKSVVKYNTFPDSEHYKVTILYYLCAILSHISWHLNMVNRPTNEVHVFEFYHMNKVLPKVLKERNLLPPEKIERFKLLYISDVYIGEDDTPFYKAVFRALKKLGYDWTYYCPMFAGIIHNLIEYHQVKWSPTLQNSDGFTASDLLKLNQILLKKLKLECNDPLDEVEICTLFNNRMPDSSIIAYLEVNNKLPLHYPLTVSYYKRLYDED